MSSRIEGSFFSLSTLPSAACWCLLSVLSPHVPKVASSRLAHPHTIITKGWWGKGMAFLLLWGEKSLFFDLHCSSKLPLRSPWLGLGQCPYPNCKGSWVFRQRRRAKKEHSLGSQQGLLINLDVPGPLCAWQRAGPQRICGMNTVE